MQIVENLTVVNHLNLSLPKLKILAGKQLYYKLNLSLQNSLRQKDNFQWWIKIANIESGMTQS